MGADADLTCRAPQRQTRRVRRHRPPYPWPAGPTHPSNIKGYCTHHLAKTFVPGFCDRQKPDGNNPNSLRPPARLPHPPIQSPCCSRPEHRHRRTARPAAPAATGSRLRLVKMPKRNGPAPRNGNTASTPSGHSIAESPAPPFAGTLFLAGATFQLALRSPIWSVIIPHRRAQFGDGQPGQCADERPAVDCPAPRLVGLTSTGQPAVSAAALPVTESSIARQSAGS